jgi:nucleotide-binding universal stress UspA family protein
MYRTIVVGTDGSPSAMETVRHAAAVAAQNGAALHVVCAVRESTDLLMVPEMASAMPLLTAAEAVQQQGAEVAERAATAAQEAGATVTSHVVRGEASDVLCRVSSELGADLLVVGNKGMTGAKRFVLGSVPNRVAHHAPCSVLIVHTT